MRTLKELTPEQSYQKVKDLLKEKKKLTKRDFAPGNLLFTFYDAKYQQYTFDRTPMVLILRRNRTHTLGLNFHWIPLSMRMNLIQYIIKINRKNIELGKPIQFEYAQLRPLMKSLGYSPCIRLYINNRFAQNGVIIPPERLAEVARMKTETFTKGKFSASQLFNMARSRAKKRANPGLRK